MVIFGYEEQVGDFFVPNGTPDVLIKKMTTQHPEEIFYNGCVQEDTGLESPVYHCEHYINLLSLKDISYCRKLVTDIKDEFYYYPISPFGSQNGFLELGEGQIHYSFIKSMSDKVINDLKLDKCKIIIDTMSEGHEFDMVWIKQLHKLIDSVDIPRKNVYYLTSNNKYKQTYCNIFKSQLKINVLEFPYFESAVYEQFILEKKNINFKDMNRDKYFLSFNRAVRPHRKELVHFLKSQHLLDKGYVSYYPEKLYVDIEITEGPEKNMASNIGGDIFYNNSYFSIVTETCFYEDTIFLSEKTFKSIIHLHPFILYSTPYTLKHLRSLGYKTFGNFIDESYDEIENNEERIQILNKEVKRLCNLSLQQLHKNYIDTKDILLYNFEHFQRAEERVDITL